MKICSHLDDMGALEQCFLQDPHHVLAVQRIRLTADGKKVERKTLGPMANSVVFVSSIWESFYSATATIAEGVETALAMRKLGFQGCVALAGAGRFRTFEPPFHWGHITISGENDAGASQSAWRDAGPRWAAAGHDVAIWTPPDGFKDANDLLRDKRQ
ncbi:toprim domain-containing protein [Methylocystis sp.]|uniref:toprim domain-containing protein n=1 Tax=Methylocystis sp. TaxID=1911079 RepID=UPI0025E34B40|nr:toprim domain-containing protein [Methylocystis sp.]